MTDRGPRIHIELSIDRPLARIRRILDFKVGANTTTRPHIRMTSSMVLV